MGIPCMSCPFMPSLNLLRYDEVREKAGGELRILASYLETDVGSAIYHNVGLTLGSLEDFAVGLAPLMKVDKKVAYLHMTLWDSIGDLKSSLLLAFTGHFRRAMVLLRVSLELAILGVYISVKARTSREEELKEYMEYVLGYREGLREGIRQRFGTRFNKILDELKKADLMDDDMCDECRDLYRDLSLSLIHI